MCLVNQPASVDTCVPYVSDMVYDTQEKCMAAIYKVYQSKELQLMLSLPIEDQMEIKNARCIDLLELRNAV